ncbi:outer membrane protein assembly factor BamD [Aquaspirillum soli]|jgi:outer membrane protein assembly factor BamD|nr:outer membrane protein assembly factor BamD [Aquaspirillum sp.]
MKRFVVGMLMAASLAACSTTTEPKDETRGWPVERLYYEAREELNSSNYTRSIQLYETLEARYPYGRFAQQAQMDLAYAHYKEQEPALALAAIDRFMKLYPAHPNLDYMYYLKGLVNYNDDGGIFARFTGQDRAERDPKSAREAFLAFSELVKRFPDSKYSADATKKMGDLVKGLAENELYVARHYMKRKAYVAAINRAQQVIKEFSSTEYVEESLAIMVSGYDALGQTQLRDDAKRVLAKNYPNSRYLTQDWQPRDVPWYQFW